MHHPTTASRRATLDGPRHFKVMTLVKEPPGLAEVPQLLVGGGFQVASCRSPDEGMQTITDDLEIGIVVCDISFGEMRGHQLYQRLVERIPAERPMSVVFLADAASINDVVAAMRLQAIDFLRKPAHPPSLLEAVRRADGLMYRRSTEQLMLRRATDLLDVMRAVVDWLPQAPSIYDEDQSARHNEVLVVSTETDHALALDRTKKELLRVKAALKAQKMQRKLFGAELVANPCWDMLLDLYEKMLLSRPVSVSSLALASGVPVTTALRRMRKLEQMGLVRRDKDSTDARRVFVELTDMGTDQLGQYLGAMG